MVSTPSNNPVPGNSGPFPPKEQPFVDDQDIIMGPWYQLLRLLYQRSGSGLGAVSFAPQDLLDAGNSQATAAKLIAGVNFVTASGKAVILPALVRGQICVVFNITTGQTTNVFPPNNGKINNLAVNAPYPLATGMQVFWWQQPVAQGAAQIRTMSLV
jgi:hypothetical protein